MGHQYRYACQFDWRIPGSFRPPGIDPSKRNPTKLAGRGVFHALTTGTLQGSADDPIAGAAVPMTARKTRSGIAESGMGALRLSSLRPVSMK